MTRPPDSRKKGVLPPSTSTPALPLLIYTLLLLALLSPTPSHSQSTTSTGSDSDSSSWTFNVPGVSRLLFSPPLTNSREMRLALSFRTRGLNGVLLQQTVARYDAAAVAEEDKALLDAFSLVLELSQGHLRVVHLFHHYSDILSLGRALNDDAWHRVTLALNQTSGELSVTLDTDSATQFLKAYSWGSARDVMDWSTVQSAITLGAASEERGERGEGRGDAYVSFVGCMQELRYSTDRGAPLPAMTPRVTEGVTKGCLDRCQSQDDRCKNNGRCVNLYTDFHCDCFGTDYEGRHCQVPGPSVITFSGYEWLTYQLYQGDQNRTFSDHNRVSLEFKTGRASGILLYAVGGSPYHNHVTASLHSGSLHVSVAFGNDDLDFPIGIGLDDNRWHNLTISHSGKTVDVYLDGDVTTRRVSDDVDYFLSLDPLVYVGGGDNFVVTRGLPVTRNFVGCMKNVYLDDRSVVYTLAENNGTGVSRYHGGESPTLGCSPVQDIPISFPNAASVLRWRLGSRGQNLSVDFRFRTVRQDSILFYVELRSRRDNGGWDNGLIEVWIKKGHPTLMFMPSFRNVKLNENITLPTIVNDKVWHSMHIELMGSQAKLKVDALSRSTTAYRKPLSHKGQVLLGFGLRGYEQWEGYVGCMNQIDIEGERLDPISVVESTAAIGLALDGCHLLDHCSLNNICEHGAQCLSDWGGVQCLCQGGAYEGKACHFPRYPASCDAYYQAGHRTSGVYLIDVDGSGNQAPTHVQCSMGSQRDGALYGMTLLEHNFKLNTAVRGALLEDRRYHLDYREMSRIQLVKLGEISASCEQYFKYSCRQAPILLGKKTWFKAAEGQVVDYIGAASSGFCTCPDSDNGLCDGQRCYCDNNGAETTRDEGFSHSKQQLPITEVTFLQDRASAGQANMTLGPFTCWGSDKQHLNNLVTLTTEESHVTLAPWRRGALGLHFKTHNQRALLLMQTSNDTSVFGNRFTLKIVSENSVEFGFKLNGTVVRETLRVAGTLSQGDWHSVTVEHDAYNVRLGLDTARKMLALSPALTGLLDFDDLLYVGGLPPEVASSYGENTPGFAGCLRAFLYNDEEVELAMLLDKSVTGVSAGCMSSCWPNPCQHGGTCKEDWGHYTCLCRDPWAHQGHNCEHNLNSDAVTLTGDSSSYLAFDLSRQPSLLDQTIVLSFRTRQRDALLLYAYDQRSNFVQMELQDADTIVFTYNTYRTIVTGQISSPEPLNNGEWQQVIAKEYYNLTKLILGDKSEIVEYKRIKLDRYFPDPFKDSVKGESVFIAARGFREPAPFVRLYVGGVREEGGSAATTPFLAGCLRGMRIGNYHVSFSQGVLLRGEGANVTAACEAGCSGDTCLNNGYCLEEWRHANFTCDCSESDFSGERCEKEASVLLDGQSVLEHAFTLPQAAQRSRTEQLSLNFRTEGSTEVNAAGEVVDMAIFYVKSSQSSDYILARIDSDGNVLIETNQGVGIYRMKVSGDFANGELHELFYKREGTNMYLTVRPLDSAGDWIIDGMREASIIYPDHDLDKIDTVLIGGLLPGDENDFQDTANFTGCVSNTVFIPEANLEMKIRSLKDFNGRVTSDITVHGPDVITCSEAMLRGRLVTAKPDEVVVTEDSFETLTMPSWTVGPARVVTLSPSIVPPTTPAPATPPTSTPVQPTRAVVLQNSGRVVDDYTILIAISVVAFILLATIIVALILFRKRRRHYGGKKDGGDEMLELKQPLNYHAIPPLSSGPSPAPSPAPSPNVGCVPSDHLAKLDEFSMITALLGPKRPVTNGVPTHISDSAQKRSSVGSLPKADEGATFEHPIFNKRKQRPASSISEVLEELERRQNSRHTDSAENIVGRPHGEGDLEWDPQADRTPLTYEDITFFNTPLLAPIPDENEDSHVSSLSERSSDVKEKPEDSSPSADESHGNQNSLFDGNGDSGYEAESRPEVTEDDVTPTGDDDEDGLDEEDDDATQPKLYMYNISGMDPEDSPLHLSSSSPTRRLIDKNGADT